MELLAGVGYEDVFTAFVGLGFFALTVPLFDGYDFELVAYSTGTPGYAGGWTDDTEVERSEVADEFPVAFNLLMVVAF